MDLPDSLPPNQYAVYALIDPTDQLIYYVGQTRKPSVRFAQHLTMRHHKGNKAAWLRRLGQQGQQPHMQILEFVEGQEAALAKEQEWIRHFIEKGMPLLNGEVQPKADRWAIIPLRQETLVLFGYPIVIAWLLNGDMAASLKSLCNMLKLTKHGQIQRIRRDEMLSEQLLFVVVGTPGGPQATEMLPVKAIGPWLKGLELNMVAPEKRPTILALMREAPDVFYRHSHKVDTDQRALLPPNPSAEVSPSPRQMKHRAFERLHQAADALHQVADELDESYMVAQEKIEAMGDHIVTLEAEVAALKREPARDTLRQTTVNPVPSDGPRLSKDHLYQMYALAHDERRRNGQRVDLLLRELAEAFGVEDMSDIPDAAWEAVATWFWERRRRR